MRPDVSSSSSASSDPSSTDAMFADAARVPFVDDLLFSRLKSYDDAWIVFLYVSVNLCKKLCVTSLCAATKPYGLIKTAKGGSLFVGDWFVQLRLRPLIWFSQPPYNALGISVEVVIAQKFLTIYALFRNMNYYDMNAPFLENFFSAVKDAALKLSMAIVGEHAIHVLCKKRGSEGEMKSSASDIRE